MKQKIKNPEFEKLIEEFDINEALTIYEKNDEFCIYKDKERSSYIWTVGTDWILYLLRWEGIIDFIKKQESSKKDLSLFFKIRFNLLEKEELEEDRFSIELIENIDTQIGQDKNEDKNLSSWFMTFKDEEILIEKDIQSLNAKKVIFGRSALRQLIELGLSFGYLSFKQNVLKKDDKESFIFDIIIPYESNLKYNKFENDEDLLTTKLNYAIENFDYRNLGKYSLKDIVLGIHFTFLSGIIQNKKQIDYDQLNDINWWFRKRKSRSEKINEYDWTLLRDSQKNKSSICKNFNTQTRIAKIFKEQDEKLLNVLIEFNKELIKKYKRGWAPINKFPGYHNMEMWKGSGKRPGQNQYRLQMLNSSKRIESSDKKYKINIHDLVQKGNVSSPKLVEAVHLLDFRKCSNEDEQYDPENGLLLDPLIHTYFDKDVVTFDEEGNFLIKKEYTKEISMLINNIFIKDKISENILTNETKKYIKRRIETRNINLDEYENFHKR